MSSRTNLTTLRVISVFLVALGAAATAAGGTIYVDVDASGANDGSSWTDAYNYLQDALTVSSSGDEIWVAQGIYKPDQGAGVTPGDRTATFQLINGVAIKGGYAGYGEADPNVRDIEAYETILSGDLNGDDGPNFANNGENNYNVVTIGTVDSNTVLDGFTIRGGNANGSSSERCGGGIFNNGGSSTLTNCTFSGNRARWFGGGMYNVGGSPTLTNCSFIGNLASDDGGGMGNYSSSSPELINCTFSSNTASDRGGGVRTYYSSCILTNCLFNGNRSFGGAGMDSTRSSMVLTNCTFSRNQAAHAGGGIYTTSGNIPVVTNCIFWGNSHFSAVISESSQISAGNVNYSCVQGWTGNFGGVGNIGYDPLFVDANGADNIFGTEDDNLRLLSTSPCINGGDNTAVPVEVVTDLDGNPRIKDDVVDMGVYEANCVWPVIGISPHAVEFDAIPGDANPDDQILTISNNGVGTLYWEIAEDCAWLSVDLNSGSSTGEGNEVTLSVDISGLSGGTYNCNLTISDPCALNSPKMVDVSLVIHGPAPEIELSAFIFVFDANLDGANPEDQILTVTNSGVGTLNWEIAEGCAWLSVDPNSGSSTGEANEVTLSVDISGLSEDTYDCNLTVFAPFSLNSPQTVDVSLVILGPEIELSAVKFEFSALAGGANPAGQILSIRNSSVSTLNWDIAYDCNWLEINPDSGSSTGEADEVTLSVDIAALSEGYYDCNLVVSDPNALNSPQIVTVTLNVLPIGLNYDAESYVYAHAVSPFGAASDTDTDQDFSSNSKVESLAEADATYSPFPGWYVEWQRNSTSVSLEGISDANGACLVSTLSGSGGWGWFDEMGGAAFGSGGGDGKGYASSEEGLESTVMIDLLIRANGDLDDDGDVDLADFAVLASQWQQVPGVPSADIAPICGNGIVDIFDLAMLRESWLWKE